MAQGICSIEGCDRKIYGHGWCNAHWRRNRRHGDPLGGGPPRLHIPIEERFWLRVDKDGPVPIHRPELGPCWIWTGHLDKDGYGGLSTGGRTRGAHVRAYELFVAPVPAGLDVDHLCHNGSGCRLDAGCPHRACVNPAHLEPIWRGVNFMRGEGPAAVNARKTHCKYGHEFTPENTYYPPTTGGRHCRTCDRRRDAERYLLRRKQKKK